MLRRGPLATLFVAALLLAPAASALAQNSLYNDYRRTGQVNPCKYSPGQVRRQLQNLPPDVQQYAPGLADQLRRPCAAAPAAAPVQRQSTSAPTPTGGPPAPPPAPRKARVLAPPAPKSPTVRVVDATAPLVPQSSVAGLPSWLALGLGLLAALALALLLAMRYAGLELESLTRPLRASLAEAGGHAGDLAGDLRDRLRLGR